MCRNMTTNKSILKKQKTNKVFHTPWSWRLKPLHSTCRCNFLIRLQRDAQTTPAVSKIIEAFLSRPSLLKSYQQLQPAFSLQSDTRPWPLAAGFKSISFLLFFLPALVYLSVSLTHRHTHTEASLLLFSFFPPFFPRQPRPSSAV